LKKCACLLGQDDTHGKALRIRANARTKPARGGMQKPIGQARYPPKMKRQRGGGRGGGVGVGGLPEASKAIRLKTLLRLTGRSAIKCLPPEKERKTRVEHWSFGSSRRGGVNGWNISPGTVHHPTKRRDGKREGEDLSFTWVGDLPNGTYS